MEITPVVRLMSDQRRAQISPRRAPVNKASCVITENCVTLSIDKDGDAKVWAEKIEKAKGYKRIDRTDEVRRAGYDLSAQNFYELV